MGMGLDSRALGALLFITVFLFVFIIAGTALAKSDLSIAVSDIVFSKSEPLAGETVRIFARVFNIGDEDVYGNVLFLNNGKEMAELQPISVRVNTYDDVFIDWLVEQGSYDIEVQIVKTQPPDDNPENNVAIKENYFVDFDTDSDGIGNSKDLDDDDDGLSDEAEGFWGTNPLVADTDQDGVKDKDDAFPLNMDEFQDTDGDGIGNNADEDDDNDGLPDEKELWEYESNPLKPDTDEDGLSDKEEAELGTDLLKADSDGDGVIDIKDRFPLDVSKAHASIFGSIQDFAANKGLTSTRVLAGVALLFLVFLIIFFARRRRRYR